MFTPSLTFIGAHLQAQIAVMRKFVIAPILFRNTYKKQ